MRPSNNCTTRPSDAVLCAALFGAPMLAIFIATLTGWWC